ncbi:MAG: hypothetical protein KGZ83_09780 [Sulfuricella sp.]|nr:hypothetical protein [Sulfuricella sp.]
MRFMNILSLVLTITLLATDFAFGAAPVYKDGLLAIPSVNTADQVGKYQDITFKLTEQGFWQLTSLSAIGVSNGTSVLGLPLIEKVEVVKTDSFPAQVLLRVSGGFENCYNRTLGQINQRLENNQFDIAITFNAAASTPVACGGAMVSFLRTIPMPVYGLSAGIYSYNVNGTKGTFELTVDNKLPGDY